MESEVQARTGFGTAQTCPPLSGPPPPDMLYKDVAGRMWEDVGSLPREESDIALSLLPCPPLSLSLSPLLSASAIVSLPRPTILLSPNPCRLL